MIALTRIRLDPASRAYLQRRKAEGKSTREAIRCLKCYVARMVCKHLRGAHVTHGRPRRPDRHTAASESQSTPTPRARQRGPPGPGLTARRAEG